VVEELDSGGDETKSSVLVGFDDALRDGWVGEGGREISEGDSRESKREKLTLTKSLV